MVFNCNWNEAHDGSSLTCTSRATWPLWHERVTLEDKCSKGFKLWIVLNISVREYAEPAWLDNVNPGLNIFFCPLQQPRKAVTEVLRQGKTIINRKLGENRCGLARHLEFSRTKTPFAPHAVSQNKSNIFSKIISFILTFPHCTHKIYLILSSLEPLHYAPYGYNRLYSTKMAN